MEYKQISPTELKIPIKIDLYTTSRQYKTIIDRVAKAWELFNSTSVEVATYRSGEGYYLGCKLDSEFNYHIHLLPNGQASLKSGNKPRKKLELKHIYDACKKFDQGVNAFVMAGILYIWAGYYIEKDKKISGWCDKSLDARKYIEETLDVCPNWKHNLFSMTLLRR